MKSLSSDLVAAVPSGISEQRTASVRKSRRYFNVQNVECWDTLNVRAQADSNSPKVGELGVSATCVEYQGEQHEIS